MGFAGKSFHFPRGGQDRWPPETLWSRSGISGGGKVMGFAGKSLHFPGGEKREAVERRET